MAAPIPARWATAPTRDGKQAIVLGIVADPTPLVALRLSAGRRRYVWSGWIDREGMTFVPKPPGPASPGLRPSLLRFDGPPGFGGGRVQLEALPVGGRWVKVAELDLPV